MGEEIKKDNEALITNENNNSKQEIADDARGLFEKIKDFLYELLDFRNDTDQQATINAIKQDIPLKGATSWILICSIFVASVGLNANSTAVVIGAMLISPLMGPILGIGMSIAINDIDTLKKSLTNLAVMIVLSLLTAFLFFFLFPIKSETSELLGRVRPDIRDVLIAFFGGLALIIARTKKGTIASVIFGVAIATALMPPLCTAGYGLAIWNLDYFTGAMYLFTINTIFIALATFIVLKLLGFTMMRYVNSAKRRRTAQIASLIAVLVMVPAVLTFLRVLDESVTASNYESFLNKEVLSNESLWLQREKMSVEDQKIRLYFNGKIDQVTITDLKNELKDYDKINDFELEINANESRSADDISKSLTRAYDDLDEKDNIINGLQKEIEELKGKVTSLQTTIERNDKRSIPFSRIAKDAKIRFSEVQEIQFSNVLSTKDFIKVDTIPKATIIWNKKLKKAYVAKKENELRAWLQKEMNLDTLFISN